MKFSEWLKINEGAVPLRHRPEMDEIDIKKSEISVGDIVELGPETEYKGKKVNRIGQITHIRGHEAIIKDLTQGKISAIPIDHLYDKEELKGIRLTPSEEKQLNLLGGKKLWVKLSERQYKKYKSQYESKMKPVIDDAGGSDSTSKELLRMFSPSSSKSEPPKLSMFTKPTSGSPNPLSRFIKKDLFGGN